MKGMSFFSQVVFRYGIRDSFRFIKDYCLIRKELEEKLSLIAERHSVSKPGNRYQKYLNINLWLYEHLKRFYKLGLHRTSSKKILDIGTGTGYFPFICNYYGHHAEGLDVADNEMYNEMIAALGVKRYDQRIIAFSPIHVSDKYDLVTAFLICFNNHDTPLLWHIEQWDYFLGDITSKNLLAGGEIYLLFNAENKEEPVKRELLEHFRKLGAEVGIQEALFKTSGSQSPGDRDPLSAP